MKRRFLWTVSGFTFVVLIVMIVFFRWAWISPNISDMDCRLLKNGAWISVDWTSQTVDEVAVVQLAESTSRRQIQYLFPFTTYLKPDGSFSPSYDYATEFVSAYRRSNQETYLLAWIGIPLINDKGLGIQGSVDLANEATREQIIEFAVKLVEEAGFDGVHLDAEPVRGGDENYLLLLDEVKSAIGTRKILSVAGSYWLPEAINSISVIEGFKWDSQYYQAVASRVDQIVTMTYDSVMPHPALYRLWIREQVRGIEKSLISSDVELLFGISISRENTLTHRPNAENMQNGLAGICAGLSDPTNSEKVAEGISIYAAWEAETTDWEMWGNWLTPYPPGGSIKSLD